MTPKVPHDSMDLQILGLIEQRITVRAIGRSLGVSHVSILKRIKNHLIPSGLVIKDVTGSFQVIKANLKAFRENGYQGGNQKIDSEKVGSNTPSLETFNTPQVTSPDQRGGSVVTTSGPRDPFPGKIRIHNLRFKIPLAQYLEPRRFDELVSIKEFPAHIVKLSNWKKIDMVFMNYRAMVTPRYCIIYGVQAYGSHLEETHDVQDRAWQLVEPDLEKLQISLRKIHPKIKFRRDSGGIIVSEILTREIADEKDQGAAYMLRGRSYYVVRDPHNGRRKFVLDRSMGHEEAEGVDPLTSADDMENFRKFKLSLGPRAYDNLMLNVASGYDIVRETQSMKDQISGILEIMKEQVKKHELSQGELDQLRDITKEIVGIMKGGPV